MNPEALQKVQEFAQRVIDAFENNPEARKAFLESVDGIKQDVFKSPEMFRAFVNRAYEKHADALTKLEGSARTQKIKDFSVFIRDVMLQFADMNSMSRFSLAIQAQRDALERKELDTHLEIENKLDALKKRINPGVKPDWSKEA